MDVNRKRGTPLRFCIKCSDTMIAATTSKYVSERSIRNSWSCDACGFGFGTADVPLFVEHCEAVAAEIDVKLRWLGEQARRGLSVWSGALPVRHVMLEVACEPSVVGSL